MIQSLAELSSPGASTPGASTPGASTPGASTPGVSTPGAPTPGQIQLRVPGKSTVQIGTVLTSLAENKNCFWPPFDQRLMDFAAQFSATVLACKNLLEYPELAALGFWFRKKKLQDLHSHYLQSGPQKQDGQGAGLPNLAAGCVFQLAPANVDTVFMYTGLLSLLMGNVTLVRLSSEASTQVSLLLRLLNNVLDDDRHAAIRDRIVFFQYPHNDDITRVISEYSDLRVIWGGDDTIRQIKSIECKKPPEDISFPTRYSMALLRPTGLDIADAKTLAQRFYRDAFPFAQQACSSPKTVYWLGSRQQIEPFRTVFWECLDQVLRDKNYRPEAGECMERFCCSQKMVLFADKEAQLTFKPEYNRLWLAEMKAGMEAAHTGNGLFLEVNLVLLDDLFPRLNDQHQTIGHSGLSEEELMQLESWHDSKLIKRVSPVGEALTFDEVWDGVNLIEAFSIHAAS